MSYKTVSHLVRPTLAIVLAIGFASFASATTLLQDDFNDNSLDASKWTVVKTDSQSVVADVNQQIELQRGGILNTASSFDPDTPAYDGGIKITGQWIPSRVATARI